MMTDSTWCTTLSKLSLPAPLRSVLGGEVTVLARCTSIWPLTPKHRPIDGSVGVELELLVLVTVPATIPLSCDFSMRWFASFGGADRRLPEQGRNRGRRCIDLHGLDDLLGERAV
jgi:hypothetical protein